MLVTVDSPVAPRNSAPIAVERYDAEIREYYDTSRPDCLNFRVVDERVDHRFYHPGRSDHIKEVKFDMSEAQEIDILYDAQREDGMIRYRKYAQPVAAASSSATTTGTGSSEQATLPAAHLHNVIYHIDYDVSKRKGDGLRSIALALRSGEVIDPSCDCASSIFQDKTLYLALTCNPDVHEGHVMEVYQDQVTRSLRLTVEEQSTLLPKTRLFANGTPNNDPLYEENKVVLMQAVQRMLDLEREVFLNVTIVVDIQDQKRRLEELSVKLFGALDKASPPIQL